MAEKIQLTPEQQAIKDKDRELRSTLGAAGYMFAGGGPFTIGKPQDEENLGIVLPRNIRDLTIEGARRILAKDPEALEEGLLPGWDVLPENHPETEGWVGIEYIGPVDESFEQGVRALVEYATPAPAEEAS
jgi:hypothetical protein